MKGRTVRANCVLPGTAASAWAEMRMADMVDRQHERQDTMADLRSEKDHLQWAALREELVGFVRRRVESREAAEDIVQDVLTSLQQVGTRGVGNPRAWLYRAARNATVDHYRRRRTTVPLENVENWIDDAHEEDRDAAMRELAACLRPLVAGLPEKYRNAVTAVDLEGRTHTTVAAETGISVSGMKSRVQRGRARLGDILVACCAVGVEEDGSIAGDFHCSQGCACS